MSTLAIVGHRPRDEGETLRIRVTQLEVTGTSPRTATASRIQGETPEARRERDELQTDVHDLETDDDRVDQAVGKGVAGAGAVGRARHANPSIQYDAITGNIIDAHIAAFASSHA